MGIERMRARRLTWAVLLVAATGACGDSATSPTSSPIGAADIEAMNAVIADIDAIATDPAVLSLRGVTVPFRVEIPALIRETATGSRLPANSVAAAGRIVGLIGDVDLPVRLLGGTYARVGGAFFRDAGRPGAPGNGVRVLLYQRIGGVSTDVGVGYVEVVDSLREAERRVTTALAKSMVNETVVTVRAEVKLVGPVINRAFQDVIRGTVGRGTTPIVVLDSFVVDSLSPGNGRNIVVATLPVRGLTLVRATPARPGASSRSLGLDLTLGRRSVHFEGSLNVGTGGYGLIVFVNGADVARVSTNDLLHFGSNATSPNGDQLPQVLRDWLDAVGTLLLIMPAAAELSDAASNLVSALP